MLRYKTEIAWFSRLVRHSEQSRSILTIWSPHGVPEKRFLYICAVM